jgi:hypothetical protein
VLLILQGLFRSCRFSGQFTARAISPSIALCRPSMFLSCARALSGLARSADSYTALVFIFAAAGNNFKGTAPFSPLTCKSNLLPCACPLCLSTTWQALAEKRFVCRCRPAPAVSMPFALKAIVAFCCPCLLTAFWRATHALRCGLKICVLLHKQGLNSTLRLLSPPPLMALALV